MKPSAAGNMAGGLRYKPQVASAGEEARNFAAGVSGQALPRHQVAKRCNVN
jgi:hypothetical protein